VALGQLLRVHVVRNRKLLQSRHALQSCKACERHLAAARHELQELAHLDLVVLLESAPEPLHLVALLGVASVLSVGLHVLQVDPGQSLNQEPQLLRGEHTDNLLGNQLMEPFQECINLVFDTRVHLVDAVSLNVVNLVLLIHVDIGAIFD